MTKPEVRIITTEDGSHSLFVESLNETYHSTRGANTESRYVFIESGIDYYVDVTKLTAVSVLEIGFGTGLNALLAMEHATSNQIFINYTTLEPFPLNEEVFSQLNYCEGELSDWKDRFIQLHSSDWGALHQVTSHFSFRKLAETVQGFESNQKFDVVFFDAFAPSRQGELWQIEVFEKLMSMMNKQGVIVTYCAQGQFKRNLKSLGLEVETLPGPPGKKEMVRATKF